MHSTLSIIELEAQSQSPSSGAKTRENILARSDLEVGTTRTQTSAWAICLQCDGKEVELRLKNPFTNWDTHSHFSIPDQENLVRWYLEKHTEEPFEAPKAEQAAELLASYGRTLAKFLTTSGILPHHGHLDVEVISKPPRTPTIKGPSVADLHSLHWEVLEDISLWPEEYALQSVAVSRCVVGTPSHEGLDGTRTPRVQSLGLNASRPKGLSILLIVSRPKAPDDPDYQLVARQLLAALDGISKQSNNFKSSVHILRPPSWMAFREHLTVECEPGHYDIVHFDMHGEILDSVSGGPRAVLKFCRQSRNDPFKMEADDRSGEEIGKVLARACIHFAVLNACDSASARLGNPNSNLAKSLFRYGVSSVLAMSYKATEEAVEIFMSTFYTNLLQDAEHQSFHRAANSARLALLHTRNRRARHMQKVQLSDYIVPVLYLNQRLASLPLPPQPSLATRLSDVFKMALFALGNIVAICLEHSIGLNPLSSNRTSWASFPLLHFFIGFLGYFARSRFLQNLILGKQDSTPTPPVLPALLGRDLDILQLEIQFLSQYNQKTMLLHGQGGCGKTVLIKHACQWWKSTGWVAGYGYLDMETWSKHHASFEDFCNSLAGQLGGEIPIRNEIALIEFFQNNRYLLALDHVEVLSNQVSEVHLDTLERLRSFVIEASRGQSMVIVCSRYDNSPLTGPLLDESLFHLSGLSTIPAMELACRVAFDSTDNAPTLIEATRQVDMLARAVILLDGNPSAIKMVMPGLGKGSTTAESLLTSLLFDAVELDKRELSGCRFAKTVHQTIERIEKEESLKDLSSAACLAPFWSIIPSELEVYFWHFRVSKTSPAPERNYDTWLDSADRRQILQEVFAPDHLPKILALLHGTLMESGVLGHAKIERNDGSKLSCFQIHPIFTLLARSKYVGHEDWKHIKYAYVRHFILWDNVKGSLAGERGDEMAWFISQGLKQNMDHLNNMRLTALAYSLDESDLLAEIECHDKPVFELVGRSIKGPLYYLDRYSALLTPLFEKHMLRLHILLLCRPGGVPQLDDLTLISWPTEVMFQIIKDFGVVHAHVEALLSAFAAWQEAHPNTPLPEETEESWFQMRYAQAFLSMKTRNYATAKVLIERNLRDEPQSNPQSWYSRSVQYDNFRNWVECAGHEALANGSSPNTAEVIKKTEEMVKKFKPGNLQDHLMRFHENNPDYGQTLSLGELYGPFLEKQKDVVATFGSVAKAVIYQPFLKNFEGLASAMLGHSPTQATNNAFTMADLVGICHDLSQSPYAGPECRATIRMQEVALRKTVGDENGTNSLISEILEQESLPSDTSFGYLAQLGLHSALYETAVTQASEPDYKKGPFHLNKMCEIHKGIGVPARVMIQEHLDAAQCYDGLNMPAKAGRAVLKAVEHIPRMGTETIGENAEFNAHTACLGRYLRISKLRVLDVFDKGGDWSHIPGAVEAFSLSEKRLLRKIVNGANEIQNLHSMVMNLVNTSQENLQTGYSEETIARMWMRIEEILNGLFPYYC